MFPPARPQPAPSRPGLDTCCSALAFAVPLAVCVLRAATSTQWRDDVALVRGLGLVPLGFEGALSSLLVQAFSLAPVGGRILRAALVSALGVGLAAWLVYRLTRRLLDRNAATPGLTAGSNR